VHITAGICAGVVATTVTFPADVVMRSMQVAGGKRGGKFNGIFDCFVSLHRQHGKRVFMKGIMPELCKSVPVAATALVVNTWALGKMGIKKSWD